MTGAGAIPYRLRIGVSGQRTLPDDPALPTRIRETLRRIAGAAPASSVTPVQLVVLSSLAEGVDRLLAQIVLAEPGGTLEVLLPLPHDEYLHDFPTEASRQEFEDLLGRASRVATLPAVGCRADAYDEAGLEVLAECDVLIAVWDGQPARGRDGTADVVLAAAQARVPVFWVDTAPPFSVVAPQAGVPLADFRRLDRYNREALNAHMIATETQREVERFLALAAGASLDTAALRPYASWMVAHSVRADRLASRHQRQFLGLSLMLLVLPVLAVVCAVVQALWWHGWLLSLGEALLLATGLGLVILLRRAGSHARWLSYRYLAERLRAGTFVRLTETAPHRARTQAAASVLLSVQDWPERAFNVVQAACPLAPALPIEGVKHFLTDAWIQDQQGYQQRTHTKLARRQQRIAWATAGVFGTTLLAALLHGFVEQAPLRLAAESPLTTWLTFAAIAFPAVGAAMSAFAAEREYSRHQMRSRRMADWLATLRYRLLRATTAARVRAIATEAEAVMLSENHDWFTAMQFHEAELHS